MRVQTMSVKGGDVVEGSYLVVNIDVCGSAFKEQIILQLPVSIIGKIKIGNIGIAGMEPHIPQHKQGRPCLLPFADGVFSRWQYACICFVSGNIFCQYLLL